MIALILVDIQNDFLPGGALAVPDGDAILPLVNEIQPRYDLVAATQDWHPRGHLSFASSHENREPFETIELDGIEQVLWPDHCVRGTDGAEFAGGLDLRRVAAIFRKGSDPRIDSYSGFFDNGRKRSTGLGDWLKGMGVDCVHVAGLAADYCVAFTAADARELGFETAILEDGTRPIGEADWREKARELRDLGVRIASADDLIG